MIYAAVRQMEFFSMGDSPGKRLALFRRENGLSQRALASAIGMTQGPIGLIETGKLQPSSRVLRDLAKTFGLSSDWLLNGQGEMLSQTGFSEGGARFSQQQKSSRSDTSDQSSVGFAGQDLSLIRRGRINTDGGAGIVLHDDPMAGALAFDTRWLAKKGVSGDLALLVEAIDDTMAPTIPDGALVLVHIAEMYATEPGIYAVVKDGRPALRRITPVTGNEGPRPPLMVQSDADPAPELLSGDDLTRLRIVGRVRVVVGAL